MSATTASEGATRLMARVLGPDPPPFALIYRPQAPGPDTVDVLVGEISALATLAEVELGDETGPTGMPVHDVLTLLPYRQISERGFDHIDDGEPLIAMSIIEQATIPLTAGLMLLPDEPIELLGGQFVPDDDDYATQVKEIINDVIGSGEGSNFVIKRSFVTTIEDYSIRRALSFFRRALERETGAYWTFIVHTGSRTFVGATPEPHVTLRAGVASMTPISGTYRYPPLGPVLSEVIDFLADGKETDELFMVVDEELKMMSQICDEGAQARGPFLKEMARLAHTEYVIEGHTIRDPREILRETMFAPTVTGSPLESACRVIARYEPCGRGYYGGVLALIGRDNAGRRTLDSALLIRTADINNDGKVDIGVGATLVRHSNPDSEVAETRAKAAGLIAALTTETATPLGDHPDVRAALGRRNRTIADFWLADHGGAAEQAGRALDGRRVLIVDGEDSFTSMLDYQLRSLGITVTVARYEQPHPFDDYDLVVMGPGPGDPRAEDDVKIASLTGTLDTLLAERRPFVAICLSHQLLSLRLGLDLRRRDQPSQGVQRKIDLFGSVNRVGFYNTFAAFSEYDSLRCEGVGDVLISRDAATQEVHALRGAHFASMQFHPESVLTQEGVGIVADVMRGVLHL